MSHAHAHTPAQGPFDETIEQVRHASASVEVAVAPDDFFNAFASWSRYADWAPDWQGAGHWLTVRQGGPGPSTPSRSCPTRS